MVLSSHVVRNPTWKHAGRRSLAFQSIFAYLPQVAEKNYPQPMDAVGEGSLYDESMTRVFIADALLEERNALRVVLQDLLMVMVGEAEDWVTTLARAPATDLDMLVVDWNLLPTDLGVQALGILRKACSNAIIVVLISHLDSRHQAALSAGADAFISKNESPERVAERFRMVANKLAIQKAADQ